MPRRGLVLILLSVAVLAACGSPTPTDDHSVAGSDSHSRGWPIDIVDMVDVVMLTDIHGISFSSQGEGLYVASHDGPEKYHAGWTDVGLSE